MFTFTRFNASITTPDFTILSTGELQVNEGMKLISSNQGLSSSSIIISNPRISKHFCLLKS